MQDSQKLNHDTSHQNVYRVTFKFVPLTPLAFVRASARGLVKTEPRLLAEAADPMKNIRILFWTLKALHATI